MPPFWKKNQHFGGKKHSIPPPNRVEECETPGDPCPISPDPYGAECVQKAVYHRFLVFDPYDADWPFGIDSFKMPASCSCLSPR